MLAIALASVDTIHPKSFGSIRMWTLELVSRKIQASPDGAGVSVRDMIIYPSPSGLGVAECNLGMTNPPFRVLVGTLSGPPMAWPLPKG